MRQYFFIAKLALFCYNYQLDITKDSSGLGVADKNATEGIYLLYVFGIAKDFCNVSKLTMWSLLSTKKGVLSHGYNQG